MRDASSLYSLRKDAPPDGEALARRAQSDFAPVIDALWGAGYYNASVTIAIDGAALAIGSSDIAAFSRAAETYRNRSAAPVVIKVEPGPLFKLRTVRVVDALGVEFPEAELPQRIVGLKPGDPAAASEIRAAQTRIVDYFRKQGRPLAKIQSVAPVVDHAQDVMDVTIMAAPGPIAPFGEATIQGPQTFDPAIVRSFLYIHPGDPYSPAAIADARNSIREIPAVGGVRITEGKTLDAYGQLPYQIAVEDRLPYAFGASLKYSTTNGPEGQVYWEDRNVFGGAERLRLQADIFYAPPWYIASQSLTHFSSNDIGGRVSASFLKPALWGTTNDLLIDALGGEDEHERRRLRRLSGPGRGRDGLASPPLQSEFLGSGWPRSAERRKPRTRWAASITGWSAFPYPPISTRPTASSIRRAAFGSTPPPWASARSSARASTWFR